MSGHDGPAGGRDLPSAEELSRMSEDELFKLGLALDGVTLVHREEPFPLPDTRAEKRAERSVAKWFVIAAVAGVGFLGVYLFWPSEYAAPGSPDSEHLLYLLYTPLIGVLLGLSVFAVGVGVITYSKKLLPHETAVQKRHVGGSAEVDRVTTAAVMMDSANRSGLARRSLIKRAAGLGAGIFGVGVGVFALGGLVRNPWSQGPNSPLWTTSWDSKNGERVYLRYDTKELTLVRPEDLAAGSIATVFPYKKSWTEEQAREAIRGSDNPVMLIRLRPEQAAQVIDRKGQVGYNYGDFYAYSKICTHLGCPASLYEAQDARLLCPCHQSQFNMLEYAKPIFGPATRALPQLPIDVDDEGNFYARHGFIEPVGPAFWERRS